MTQPDLIVHESEPLNAEPPPGRLRANFVTPLSAFYIRCHGNLPALDAEHHRLQVDGRVERPCAFSVRDLQARFPARRVVATLQCAGNRRAELASIAAVDGAKWGPGAIGTAAWTGVALADVLDAVGCDATPGLDALALEGADTITEDGTRFVYGASIPLAKARTPEVLLAFAMNGAPLPPEHGYPLRLVVPGQIGARSVKWVTRVRVQDHPSDNPFQQRE